MPETMRSLYLSYDGMTDPLGQSQVLPYLQGLAKQGWEITLISFEKQERFSQEKATIEAITQAAGIRWIPLPYTKKPPVLSTLWDLYKLFQTVKKEHRNQPFQLVHCRSYITAFAGLHLKKKHGVSFLFDMRGFYADERVEGGIWNLKNPLFKRIYQFFKSAEQKFLTQADAMVCLTHKGKAVMKDFPGITPDIHEKIAVIPCCTDMDHFSQTQVQPAMVDTWKTKLALPTGAELIAYLGSLGTWYLVEDMVRFVAAAHARRPQLVWLIITRDSPNELLSAAEKHGLPKEAIRIFPAKREELPSLLSLVNASLFFIQPSFSKQASSPTKQGELMAMGIPVICNAGVGDSDFLVQKYQSGLVVEKMEEADFKKVLDRWEELLHPDAEAIRRGAYDYFSLEKGVATYAGIYTSLTQK